MNTPQKHTFQAEIQQLLDIVIHSLYTDREVFLRELLSNASDACEKFRFIQTQGNADVLQPDRPPTISVTADESAATLTITDSGIGMTRDELVENLGTIAHSGTKAFLKQISENKKPDANLIGQFGVGFYSAFMAAKRVTVLTRSHQPGESGWSWTSEGAGGYEISPADDLPRGTQIRLELKDDAKDFAATSTLERVIRRYSNFVQFPIELAGKQLNTVQAIWARNRSEVKDEEYREFYKYLGHDSEDPLYRLHFTSDAPISIQALLFVPSQNFETLGMFRSESEVNLYCRKVLIEPRAKGLFPEWLRFLKGVVDSEDLPLNVSREKMQDSELLRKLNRALTGRFLKFLSEESEKNPDQYQKFYAQFSRFLKEGLLNDWDHRDALAKLLRFESSTTEPNKTTSLADYVQRMPEDQKEIYFLLAASREAAEASPYFEVFKSRKYEVLFLRDPIDEFVMDRLPEFNGKPIRAAEKADLALNETDQKSGLSSESADALAQWLKNKLGDSISAVRVSKRLSDSPAVIVESDEGMTATMRKTLKMMGRSNDLPSSPPDVELNPAHPLVISLDSLRNSNPDLAQKIGEQLIDNARMSAGLLEDSRPMLRRIQELLEKLAQGPGANPA